MNLFTPVATMRLLRKPRGWRDLLSGPTHLELAQAGFITLTLGHRGLGRLGDLDHLQVDASARPVGRT